MKNNLLFYYKNSDDALLYLKVFCSDKNDGVTMYEKLDYLRLLFFTEEALAELLNC